MTTPQRIQRSRAKGWRMPPNTVTVSRGAIWGNPWGIGSPGTIDLVLDGVKTRYKTRSAINATEAVLMFEIWLDANLFGGIALPDMKQFTDAGKEALRSHLYARRKLILANLDQLRGHNLCCRCKPDQPCHADVLLRMANAEAQL